MLGSALLRDWAARDLVWLEDAGVGYYPVSAMPYTAEYFAKYEAYASTSLGRALTDARLSLVRSHWGGDLVDIGIGCGQFVEAARCYGYDINPAGVAWLRARGRYWNPYYQEVPAACFWDSFEHIHDPTEILANVERWVFLSLPIFEDLAHVLRSKHYRKDEHCLYFRRDGLVRFMAACGFECVEHSRIESELGREDIESFAFRRQ